MVGPDGVAPSWMVGVCLCQSGTLPETETETELKKLYCFIVQLVYVSHYIVSFIFLYCNFHLSFNHYIFTLLCVLYVLWYCTNPAFGCYTSINFFFPCTGKSRSFLLAPAHPGGPGKRAVKRWLLLWLFHIITAFCLVLSQASKS